MNYTEAGAKTLPQALGQEIRRRRILMGLSQGDLAEASGFHRSYISDTERGNRNITIINASKIGMALKISLSELLKEKQNEQRPN